MPVEILVREGVEQVLKPLMARETLQKRAEKLLNALGCPEAELSLLLTDDAEIKELNAQYRNKDSATDVLSFALEEAGALADGPRQLGDVVVSLETAIRQASERERSSAQEVLFLVIHGTLHLLGYDHEDVSTEERHRMERKEDELFLLLDSEPG